MAKATQPLKKAAARNAKTAVKKAAVKPLPAKATAPAKKSIAQPAQKVAPRPAPSRPLLKKTAKQVIFVDSSMFFPDTSAAGYADDYQEGRYTTEANRLLQAPIVLPVGTKIKSITIYYKNNTTESMPVAILKKHIAHHAPSGEVEVSLDDCPPGTAPPDDFLAKVIDHFDNAGVIRNDYLYFIQIFNTARIDDAQKRLVRGMRIEVQL